MDKLPSKEVSGALASITQRFLTFCSKTNMILGVLNYFYFSAVLFFLNTLPTLTPAKFIGTLEVSQPAHKRCALLLKEMDGFWMELFWLTRNQVYSQKTMKKLYKLLQACSVLLWKSLKIL